MFPTTLQHIYLLKETFSQPNLTMFEKVGMTGWTKAATLLKPYHFLTVVHKQKWPYLLYIVIV